VLLSALSAIFQLLAKHLALDLSATLIFVPFAIAPVRTMVNNINYHAWCRRTKEECLASAKAFDNAQTKSEQDTVFASSGVKWSELLHLLYFDPTSFIIINVMHNLLLGLINEHLQDILGI
jgi:hypothetical protein